MYLKTDFMAALRDAVLSRPAVAAAYRAGDPRLLAQVEAIATMMTMLSQQIDVAEVEPFLKARAGTVLADAALKGILPLARPARVSVSVANPGTSAVALAAGRIIVDGKGRRYAIEGSGVAPAGGSVTVTAIQRTTRTQSHTVSGSAPFYAVRVDESTDGALLCGIEVSDPVGQFTYTADFCNVAAGQRVFHAETDERRRLWIRFGAADVNGSVVGFQPPDGTVLTLTVSECAGAVQLDAGAQFGLEYVAGVADQSIRMTLAEVLSGGSDAPSIELLRTLARYPALHDSNAVFLSNFDFVLRRAIPGIEFLAVWNEQTEELVRGASVANINKLFVSISVVGQTTGATEALVRQIIARADDSYGVVFVAPSQIIQPVTVSARVAAVHAVADVQAQIRTRLLALYGRGTQAAATGLSRALRIQALHDDLRANVPALQDQISDFSVTLGATATPLPEQFRYFDASQMTVTVTGVQDSMGLFAL